MRRYMPKDASWKYIEALGDELIEPYGSMADIWMSEVYRRARRIRKLRKHGVHNGKA